MNQQAEIFKPGIAALQELAMKFKGLKIKGVDDEVGYGLVKDARKELGDMRILLTKFGKSKREEALAFQREVIRQEKEHLDIIVPLENELKAKIEAVDEEKKRAERMILLPNRKKLLEEIGIIVTDEFIISMDEKEFSTYHSEKKMAYFEEKERIEKEKKAAEEREEEINRERQAAAEAAVVQERERAAREKERQEKKAQLAKEDAEMMERKRIQDEKDDQEKTEKNRKYKAWLAENGYNKATENDFVVKIGEPIIPNGKKICILFKKVAGITI
jgi:hypothetical protein